MNVDIWSDIACPWCFIGKRRFEKALSDFPHRDQVTVTWHGYQLDPALPEHYDGTELEYLSERKGMPADRVAQMFDEVTQVAAEEGLEYDFGRIVVANSHAGHELLHLARAKDAAGARGIADAVKEALLSAHFEHGEDIGSRDVLVRIGAEAGLDGSEITAALEAGTYRDSVAADIRQAQALGIQGVPFFVLDNKYGVSGAQPAELFAQALDTAWREANPLAMVGPVAGADGLDGGTCGSDGCV
ncbi:putative DsbA family dithiol-disulfide isomerase [Sinomonas atrocyanea]|uniref:DsbA family oxidoreductase n=1 Tax=Sinomonas atrocyanea TaxID=37927 RepID=UPI00277E1E4D|nr:DsbA family oxidoreductase [Sinomonas atrocyanea]MDP9882792.1 putative DsbA family dithiol-disulfide isomerase [Sinomonas atrocyanea]